MIQHLVVFDLDPATSMLLDQSCRTREAFDNPTPPRTGAPVLAGNVCDVTLNSSVIRLSGTGRAYHVLTFHELFAQPPPWYPSKGEAILHRSGACHRPSRQKLQRDRSSACFLAYSPALRLAVLDNHATAHFGHACLTTTSQEASGFTCL